MNDSIFTKLRSSPWPALLIGTALLGFGWLLAQKTGGFLDPIRVTALVAGLLGLALGVMIRFRVGGWDEFDQRSITAGMLAWAATGAVVAMSALDEAWDSAVLLFRVLAIVAIAGAIIVSLPRLARRLVISVLVLLHFGAILTAVTSIAPPGGQAPWVSIMASIYVYRPYYDLLYMSNAYHFYSPDPGPPYLVWFYIEYEDGSSYKLEVPKKDAFSTRLAYQRRLAMTESVNNLNFAHTPQKQGFLSQRRLLAGMTHRPPIPNHPFLPENNQYQEPSDAAKKRLSSYARYVAHNYPNEANPDAQVKRIKVYRVRHDIILASQYQLGMSPTDPTMYYAYYQGEFDRDGNLLNDHVYDQETGELVDAPDPFLYWLIPVYRELKDKDPLRIRKNKPDINDFQLFDYMKVHAENRPEPK